MHNKYKIALQHLIFKCLTRFLLMVRVGQLDYFQQQVWNRVSVNRGLDKEFLIIYFIKQSRSLVCASNTATFVFRDKCLTCQTMRSCNSFLGEVVQLKAFCLSRGASFLVIPWGMVYGILGACGVVRGSVPCGRCPNLYCFC